MTWFTRLMGRAPSSRRAVRSVGRSAVRRGLEMLEDRQLPATGLLGPLDLTSYRQIPAVSPSSGYAPQLMNPGTTVTVRGSGFVPGSKVQFGDPTNNTPYLQAPAFSVSADGTSLQVRVPRLAMDGQLTVVSPSGARFTTTSSFTVKNYRNVNGFSFENFAFNVSWENMKDAFGKSQTNIVLPNPFGDDIVTDVADPQALAVWQIAANSLDGVGACFGMSLASLQFQHHPEMFGDYTVTPGTTATVNHLQKTGDLVDRIEALHLTQISTQMMSNAATWQTHSHSAGEIKSLLVGLFANDKAPLISIQKSATQGHCMIAYDIEPGDGANGFTNDYYISVYDPNRPFTAAERTDPSKHKSRETASRIHMNGSGRWEFQMASGAMWSGDVNATLKSLSVFAYDKIPEKPTLPTIENIVLEAGSNVLKWVLGEQKMAESTASTHPAEAVSLPESARDADALWTFHAVRLANDHLADATHGTPVEEFSIVQMEPDIGEPIRFDVR
jgi:hypothetical protein